MSDPDSPAPPPDASTVFEAWQRLRFALGAAGIGTWHLDLRSGVATYDENLNRIFGLASVETRAPLTTRLARIHPDDQERVQLTVETAIKKYPDFTLEFRIVRPDGEVRWLRDRGRIVRDERGWATAATGAVMDITDRKRLEERERMLADATQVLVSAVEYEAALKTLTAGLVPAFASWCGVHLRDGETIRLIASTGADQLAPDARQVEEATRTATPRAVRGMLVLPLRVATSAFGTLSFVSESRVFDVSHVALATELAERVALSVDRARLFRDLERANRVKDEFLATLSHELRTPLNAVLGWTRMLRQGTVPVERTATILETIERNASAQMQLVEELLDLSAMAAGGLRLNVTRVDLRDLIGGAVETVRPAADTKSLQLTVSIDERLDEIAGDGVRLRQVLWNLLSNAIKFTPAGGAIEVTAVEGPVDIEIAVRDTGPGIPADFLPYVFEPFRQADSSTTRLVGGLGLGLAIVRHIVEAHGGTVSAQSEAGRGTVLSVRLPSGRPQTDHAVPLGASTLRGRRVLAVDDDESTQELVATMLLMYGVSVRTAGRASQALQIFAEWRPDVLLADIAMPGGDGYELMRHIRSMSPPLGSIPAVALTAYTDPQSVQRAFAVGFDAHLGKPLEPHVRADGWATVLRVRRAG
jgi:PAS domain S-box-containing protein